MGRSLTRRFRGKTFQAILDEVAAPADPLDPLWTRGRALLDQVVAVLRARTLYVSGEESSSQVRGRAERVGAVVDGLSLAATTDLETALAAIESLRPVLAVVDSVQTLTSAELSGPAGSVGQVRESTVRLMEFAKGEGIRFHLQDATYAIPFPLESFDVVTIFDVGEHEPRMHRHCSEVEELTAEAGATVRVNRAAPHHLAGELLIAPAARNLLQAPREVTATFSPSMDIQISSNFERLLFEIQGRDGAINDKVLLMINNRSDFVIGATTTRHDVSGLAHDRLQT